MKVFGPPNKAASNEQNRLGALQRYRVMYTASEEPFDRITRIAARLFGTPIALITLVDESRQWFKSRYGVNFFQTSRDEAFCSHTILSSEVLIVEDATRDVRFKSNPLVHNNTVRFYAGAPLVTHDGYALGSLCVIDTLPRSMEKDQVLLLQDLAAIVMDELDLRLLRLE